MFRANSIRQDCKGRWLGVGRFHIARPSAALEVAFHDRQQMLEKHPGAQALAGIGVVDGIDEEIGIELTQAVAIAAARKFLPLTNSPLKAREVHSPTFLPRRLPIMNERGCDYEDNGIRAWFITEAST